MKLNTTALLASGLILTGVIGFLAGRISSSSSSASSESARISENRNTRSAARDEDVDDGEKARKSNRLSQSDRTEKSSPLSRKARLEAIIRGEDPLERNRALLAFLDQLGPGEFAEALDHFQSLGLMDERGGEFALLLTAWAKADPTAALAYAEEKTEGDFAKDTILTAWASRDPEAAIRWALANHEGTDANPYLAGIIRSLGQTDPTRATQLLASMPFGDERGRSLNFFLPQLLAQGPQATRDWIDRLKDPALRNGATLRSVDRLAQIDIEGTAQWLIANPSDAANDRLDNVYEVYAEKDYAAAFASYQAISPGNARSNALAGIVDTVTGQNPAAGFKLLDQYPADVNDAVIRQALWNGGQDLPLVVNNINRLEDPASRERFYNRYLDRWLDRDPAAAKAWISKNQLPPNVLNQLSRNKNYQP